MTLPEVLEAIENSPTLEVKEILSNISQKSGASIREISQGLARVSDALSKVGICLYTPDGGFRKVSEVLEDMDSNSSILLNKKEEELLGAVTPKRTENSNEKESFDFLKQNAYNDIDHIFEDISKPEYITPLDLS